ncbi:MFS transporter [Candidatus Uhrbacteria bacterium]|nr:MFS transporter [Candidatus Uhrbacteria bacterium]
MNAVVRFMILSDTVWTGALGLLGPIFSLFVVDFIEGGSPVVAGMAAAVYLISKSLFQMPFAHLVDRIAGERDDYWIMLCGSFAAALMPLFYLAVGTSGQLYAVQFAYGLVMAATFPSFIAIYVRHIDRDREAVTWGVYATVVDLSAALGASFGGIIAGSFGYRRLVVLLVVLSLAGVAALLPVRRHVIGRVRENGASAAEAVVLSPPGIGDSRR